MNTLSMDRGGEGGQGERAMRHMLENGKGFLRVEVSRPRRICRAG